VTAPKTAPKTDPKIAPQMTPKSIPTPSANRQIASAASKVMFAFVLSNLVGLVRQMLISDAFGTDRAIDAFYIAIAFPDLIFSLVAGGALSSAFIPMFTSFLAREEREAAWRLASSITNLVLMFLTTLSIISSILALPIVQHILAPDSSPAQQLLASQLLRILLISPAIFGVSGLVMGILNAHQRFWLPALAPTMYWLGMIFGLLVLVPGMGVFGLAWGAVLGAGLHLLVQLPDLLHLPDRRFHFSLGLNDPAVRKVGRLMGPRLVGVAVVQINVVVNTIIASGLAEGSLSAIKYAWQVMTMPQVVIAQAIAIAALPTFSAQVARGEMSEMRASLAATLRGMLLLSLPASLGLILLREPITALLFQRGAFDVRSTNLVAWALLWYAAGLVGHCLVEILSRAFYSLHDTKTPVLVGAAAMSLNVIFSFAFSALFSRIGWAPHGGLALGNSLATALEMAGLLVLMRRRLHGLEGKGIWNAIWKAGLAALGMSAAVYAWNTQSSGQPAWLSAAAGVILGGLVYGLMISLLRVPEVRELSQTLLGVVRRRITREAP
jgi:putative peptidoglycan lipid II flippase